MTQSIQVNKVTYKEPVSVILRGPSGAGKSTWLKEYLPEAHVVSADHFFMQNGEYVFDPTKLGLAHASCFYEYMRAINMRVPIIAVDNTNVRVSEMSPYYLAAKAFAYKVVVVRVWPTGYGDDRPALYRKLAARNSHGVPAGVIAKQMTGMEEPPPFWPEEHVITVG